MERIKSTRLLANMNISPKTVLALQEEGWDIVRVSQIMPVNTPDEDILDLARREGRAIITSSREIWMLTQQYTAQKAYDFGLVNSVVPHEELESEVERYCNLSESRFINALTKGISMIPHARIIGKNHEFSDKGRNSHSSVKMRNMTFARSQDSSACWQNSKGVCQSLCMLCDENVRFMSGSI